VSSRHPIALGAPKKSSPVVDYPNEQVPAPRDRINPASPDEIAALAKDLGVSAYHLHKVIRRVGPVLTDIYHALGLRAWEIAKRAAAAPSDPADSP
jgi:hypothetical protein